jgi:hypothetical protein
MLEYQLVTGVFTILWHQNCCGEDDAESYKFKVLQTGKEINLAFESDEQAMATPQYSVIALSIAKDPLSGGCYLVNPAKKWYTVLAEADGEFIGGKNKVHIALIRPNNRLQPMNEVQEFIDDWANDAQAFYADYGRHRWDVKVKGYAIEKPENCDPGPTNHYCIGKFMELTREDPTILGDFDPNIMHWVGGSSASYCGFASSGASVNYYDKPTCNFGTTIHELGHNVGLGHSSYDGEEYGDDSSTMGKTNIPSLHAPNLYSLNFHNPARLIEPTKTMQIQLAPIELEELSLHDNEYQYVLLENKTAWYNNKYLITIRKDVGHRWSRGKGKFNGETPILWIHETKGSGSNLIASIGYGYGDPTFDLDDDKRIELVDYDNERMLINVVFNNEASPRYNDVTVNFPNVISGVEVSEAHTGLWYDPEVGGQGFDLQVHNGRFAICWYTYNDLRVSGSYTKPFKRYYIGTGNLTTGPEEFDLITTEIPKFGVNAGKKVEKVVGRARLYFLDNENGVFDYDTEELGRGSVPLKPLLFAEQQQTPHKDNNGLWFDPTKEYEGFSINFYHKRNKDKCVAYWYTYKTTDLDRKHNIVQRWYQCIGEKVNATDYKLEVREIEGGYFKSTTAVSSKVIGTARLTIVDQDNINLSYNIHSKYKDYRGIEHTDVDKTGRYKLMRLL